MDTGSSEERAGETGRRGCALCRGTAQTYGALLSMGDAPVRSLLLGIRGETRKNDIVAAIYYRLLTQE